MMGNLKGKDTSLHAAAQVAPHIISGVIYAKIFSFPFFSYLIRVPRGRAGVKVENEKGRDRVVEWVECFPTGKK